MEKDINKIVIGEDTYNFRDNSIPEWAKGNEPTVESLGAVPTTRTVNGKQLSGNITLSASDVGALPVGTNIPVIQYIANESSMPASPTEGVLYLIGDEPTLISFTINSTSYQAEEGMTWGEWVESEYNTGNFFVNSLGDIQVSGGYVVYNGDYIKSSDIIISEINYYTSSGGTN